MSLHTDSARRRVVVTGIGAVSPSGVGAANFWEATRRRRSRALLEGFERDVALLSGFVVA